MRNMFIQGVLKYMCFSVQIIKYTILMLYAYAYYKIQESENYFKRKGTKSCFVGTSSFLKTEKGREMNSFQY